MLLQDQGTLFVCFFQSRPTPPITSSPTPIPIPSAYSEHVLLVLVGQTSSSGSKVPKTTAIAIGAGLAVAVLMFSAVIALFFVSRHRKRTSTDSQTSESQQPANVPGPPGSISPDVSLDNDVESVVPQLTFADIEICKRSDGTDWCLGTGAYGKVGDWLNVI